MSADIEIAASIRTPFVVPQGARLWLTMLMPDIDTGQGRYTLNIEAKGVTEEVARDVLRLAAERLAAASVSAAGDEANDE